MVYDKMHHIYFLSLVGSGGMIASTIVMLRCAVAMRSGSGMPSYLIRGGATTDDTSEDATCAAS